MTADEFRQAREQMGMTRGELALALGVPDDHYSARTVASWELGQRAVPPAVAKLTRLMLKVK